VRSQIALAVAKEALERIGALYAVEKDIQGRLPEERPEVRSSGSRPFLEPLKQWLEETLDKLSRKSDTAKAVRYALGRWDALMRYCDDGRLEIDNNAALRRGTSAALSLWAERITSSLVRTEVARALRRFTA
jgi:transposase